MRHLFAYEPKPTVIHKLDPRLKVLYPFIIGVVSVFLNWNFVFLLLAFTAALRYLPQLIERMTVLLQVMQVRGYDLTKPRWWEIYRWPDYIGRVFAAIPIVTVPLLIGSLRFTSTMAMVADARAFGANPNPTSLQEHIPTINDRIAIGVLGMVVVVALLLIVFRVGNRVA